MRLTLKTAAAATAVVLGVAGFGVALSAGSASADLGASVHVNANCTISTAALAFLPYDPVVANASTALDTTGGVMIACTKGTLATIGLDLGANATGSTRRMTDGAGTPSYLNYEIYSNAGYTTVWNAGAGLLSPVAAPSKASRTFTAYGRVPAGQDVTTGDYTDTVQATVNF